MAVEKRPEVLIVGRPNVGKSTLVNRLLKKNTSITLDEPGVTRDLNAYPYTWQGRDISIVDSGGVWFSKSKDMAFQSDIEELVRNASERAVKIIFLLDYKDGLHPLDSSLAQFLRAFREKVVLTVNKVDDLNITDQSHEFLKLGFGEPHLISSLHNNGITQLMNTVVKSIPRQKIEEPDNRFKITFLGRPNAGKSSLLNAIVNEERVIVSDVPGTTRDAVDVSYWQNGNQFCFTDTAGMRRRAKIDDGVEYYSVVRTNRAVETADIVVVLIDSEKGLSQQDKRLIQLTMDAKKPMIVYVNKWDLMERSDEVRKEMEADFIASMPPLEYYPIIFGSALTKHHIQKLLDLIPEVIETANRRISTSELNQFITKVIKQNPPPAKYKKTVKLYYCTQTSVAPPHFVFFVNNPDHINDKYTRFLEKRLRLYFGGFSGVTLSTSYKHST